MRPGSDVSATLKICLSLPKSVDIGGSRRRDLPARRLDVRESVERRRVTAKSLRVVLSQPERHLWEYAEKVRQQPTSSGRTRLHHLAIGSRDVERVSAFYRDVFELPEVARHYFENGSVRSIWLSLETGVLMFEHCDEVERRIEGVASGPFLLAFDVSANERERFEQRMQARGQPIEGRSEFTSYARDPDGNRVAISHYPLPFVNSGAE